MAEHRPSVKKNYFYNTLYQILTLITPLITAPYIARVFGAEGVGIQSYTNSVLTYFTLFAALGTASYGQREIAIRRDERKAVSRVFWEIECVSIITTLLSLAVWCCLIVFSKEYRPYYIAWTMSIVAILFDISWLYAGFERFKAITIRNILVKLAGICLLFAAVKSENDVALYIAILSASGLVGNMSMWIGLRQFVDRPVWNGMNLRPHFRETFVYFIPTIATSIYTVMDKTMIGKITESTAENGYYEQATKIITMGKTVIFSLNTVMSARMSYLFGKHEEDKVHRGIDISMDFILFIGIALGFGISAVAPVFVPVFFGDGYGDVIPLLNVMCPTIVIVGVSNCLGAQYFTPSGRRRDSNKIICLGAAVNFGLNLFMIRRFSSWGAAMASVVAETVITVLYVAVGRAYVNFGLIGRGLWKRLCAGVLMFVAVRWLGMRQAGIFTLLIQIITGVVVYVGILFALRDSFLLDNWKIVLEKIRIKIHCRK